MTHWHIVGAGSIGTLVASRLSAAYCQVTLLLRDEAARRELLAAGGPRLREIGAASAVTLDAVSTATPDTTGGMSHVVIATKAYAASSAADRLAKHLTRAPVIVVMTNGMGIAEQIAERLPNATVCCATTTEGAHRTEDGTIIHAGTGDTWLGLLKGGPPPDWFAAWQDCGLQARWSDRINERLWAKLAVNCAINPLTALNDCRNGQLNAQHDLWQQVIALCAEIEQVGLAAGLVSPDHQLLEEVERVIKGTAHNVSSMLQDVRAQRPTEIDAITGHLCNMATGLNVPTPLNRALLTSIRQRFPVAG